MSYCTDDISEVLLTKEQIDKRVAEVGAMLAKEYKGKNPIIVSVLKGACVFLCDLMRSIDTDVQTEFMRVSSYSHSQTTGYLNVSLDLQCPIDGRDVIIAEDIIDTGLTLAKVRDLLLSRNPRSLKIIAFLDKPERRKINIEADMTCFTIPDAFVVGYGLDYDEHYRNLPYVGILKPEVYEQA